LITVLHVLTGAALAAWAAAHVDWAPTASMAVGVAPLLAAATALGLRLARSALPSDAVHLQWDGQVWRLGLRPPTAAGAGPSEIRLVRLVVALDLGAWLLLRLHPAAGQPRWQVARASCAGPDWHGLRVALAAHAGNISWPTGESAARGPRS